jgi:formate dehydrogenase major subunit/formate dehydrogenase alpha subunit
MTNSIEDIGEADCILVSGSNTNECHPVIADVVRRAVQRRGARLIVVEPRRIALAHEAHLFLQPKPGTDVAWLNGMMHVIWKEGLWKKDFVEERTEQFEAFLAVIREYTPERVERITGIPSEQLIRAARMYGSASKAAFLYAMGLTQHISGTDNVKSVANLAMLTGNVGLRGGGVNPLRGQNNVQGACDMGGLPEVFTGYQRVTDPAIRAKFEQAWNATLSPNAGWYLTQAPEQIADGKLHGLYIMGENPLMSDADVEHLKRAFGKLSLLIVQDIFLTETARMAHVVFPSASFAEKEGTFTNTERRVQRVRKAVESPGQALDDWRIIAGLSTALGYPMAYASAREIFDELASLTPAYAGMSYKRLESGGLQWPCPTPDHPGTPVLHMHRFSRGRGLFHAVEYVPAAESPDGEYPFMLTTGRYYVHYHTGTMTRRSKGLDMLCPEGFVEMHPRDVERLALSDGERVRLRSRRGEIQIRVQRTDRCPAGVVFVPFHFHEAMANRLTNPALDPTAKTPEFKVCAVAVERA